MQRKNATPKSWIHIVHHAWNAWVSKLSQGRTRTLTAHVHRMNNIEMNWTPGMNVQWSPTQTCMILLHTRCPDGTEVPPCKANCYALAHGLNIGICVCQLVAVGDIHGCKAAIYTTITRVGLLWACNSTRSQVVQPFSSSFLSCGSRISCEIFETHTATVSKTSAPFSVSWWALPKSESKYSNTWCVMSTFTRTQWQGRLMNMKDWSAISTFSYLWLALLPQFTVLRLLFHVW